MKKNEKTIKLRDIKKLDIDIGDTIVIHPANSIETVKAIVDTLKCKIIVIDPDMIGVLKTSKFRK